MVYTRSCYFISCKEIEKDEISSDYISQADKPLGNTFTKTVTECKFTANKLMGPNFYGKQRILYSHRYTTLIT